MQSLYQTKHLTDLQLNLLHLYLHLRLRQQQSLQQHLHLHPHRLPLNLQQHLLLLRLRLPLNPQLLLHPLLNRNPDPVLQQQDLHRSLTRYIHLSSLRVSSQ